MTDPAEQAAPQPELEREDVDTGDDFDVRLPVSPGPDVPPATHVAHMSGDSIEFLDALRSFVSTGSELSAPIRMPIESSSVGQVTDILNGLGGATVRSIDPL